MNRLLIFSCLGLLTAAGGSLMAPQAAAEEATATPIGKQTEQQLQTSDGGSIAYLLSQPAAEAGEKLPLMLFLHGRGESNGPLSLVAKWGPPMIVAQGGELPFLLVSPQCPRDDRWASETQQRRLLELLDHVIQQYPVDTDRIYLTGLSLGGYGAWTLASDHPERFAAVVPICGGGDPAKAENLVAVPIWVFHGDQDRAVPFQRSAEMVEAIKAAGGERIRFTTLEHIGHNSWSAAYATPEMYQWIRQQRLSDR